MLYRLDILFTLFITAVLRSLVMFDSKTEDRTRNMQNYSILRFSFVANHDRMQN
jgi:hypothetical protein